MIGCTLEFQCRRDMLQPIDCFVLIQISQKLYVVCRLEVSEISLVGFKWTNNFKMHFQLTQFELCCWV